MGEATSRGTSRRKRPWLAVVFGALGVVLIAAALLLVAFNVNYANEAALRSEATLAKLEAGMPRFALQDYRAPSGQLASLQVEGESFAGILSLESLGLRMPVRAQEPDRSVRGEDFCPYVQACDVRTGEIVIAGANYPDQLGRIGDLAAGEAVAFTDVGGRERVFAVATIATVGADDPEALADTAQGWPLALVAPTFSGLQRTVVCCQEAKPEGLV